MMRQIDSSFLCFPRCILAALAFFLLLPCGGACASLPIPESYTSMGRVRVGLDGFSDSVLLVRMENGEERFLVRDPATGEERLLDDSELLTLLKSQAASRTWAHHFFQTSGAAGFAWVAVGLAGQILFAGRMIVQWIVSERSRKSVVPVAFWWISLVGATMLLLYFLWRKDVVGILGQSMGWLIYVRNLALIYSNGHGSQIPRHKSVA